MTQQHQAIEHCGQELWLLPDKAIYWPAQRALLVADVHIGKAASYRALHQPVPRGTTEATLARLDDLLAHYACEQLIVLGDFLHARSARAPATLARLQAWRDRHPGLHIVLIRGNHDHNAGDPPKRWASQCWMNPGCWVPSPCSTNRMLTRNGQCWPATCTRSSSCVAGPGNACACRAF